MKQKNKQCTFILSRLERAVLYGIIALFFASFLMTGCSPKMIGTKAGGKGCGVWHPKKFKA